MTSTLVRLGPPALAAALLLLRGAAPACAADFFVPSFATPTLQDAVDDAALNVDPENTIWIGAPVLFENVSIGGDFDSGHRLLICPDGAVGLTRATVSAASMVIPAFTLTGAPGTDEGYVTIQDLDIVRTGSGSTGHIVDISGMSHVTIERCRIGLNWTTGALGAFSNVQISYPIHVVVRNCVFFSKVPGHFAHALRVISMLDPASSVLFYNNLAADYRTSGIRVSDGAAPLSAVVLLRNNIAVNSPAVAPEPYGYRSEVDVATVVSSHNVVFSSIGQEESLAGGAQSIGSAGSFALRFPVGVAPLCFVTTSWTVAPPWNANPTFFRLNPVGPLHEDAGDYGQTVTVDGAPNVNDVANLLDIDRQGRPGGVPIAHTDRGPDQVDPAPATAVAESRADAGAVLFAAPARNPSRELSLTFACGEAGTLTLEWFDLAGRRLARESRVVSAGERGSWNSGTALSGTARGLVFYRAVLRTEGGVAFESSGKAVAIR